MFRQTFSVFSFGLSSKRKLEERDAIRAMFKYRLVHLQRVDLRVRSGTARREGGAAELVGGAYGESGEGDGAGGRTSGGEDRISDFKFKNFKFEDHPHGGSRLF